MKKRVLIACAGCLALVLAFGVLQRMYVEAHPKVYISEVDAAECLHCGTPNDFRGTDALGFIYVRGNRWDFENIGMIQYCREDFWAEDSCYYERIKDEALEEHELSHKNTPFDINGVLKQEIDEPFTITRSYPGSKENGSFSGTLKTIRENGLITGAFNISRCEGADADYLSSVLCQNCFDRVYPITREVNFFLSDCKTGEVYPIYGAETGNFQVGDYEFQIQLQDFRSLVFYAISSSTQKEI